MLTVSTNYFSDFFFITRKENIRSKQEEKMSTCGKTKPKSMMAAKNTSKTYNALVLHHIKAVTTFFDEIAWSKKIFSALTEQTRHPVNIRCTNNTNSCQPNASQSFLLLESKSKKIY